jgi:hypothetical protein
MKPHIIFADTTLFIDAIESIEKINEKDNEHAFDYRVGIRVTMKSGTRWNEMIDGRSRKTLRNLRYNDIMKAKG